MPTDAITDHNLLTDLTVGQLIGIMATLVVIVGFTRKFWPVLKRLDHLLDDWFGEPPRAGVRERKGVMQRLSDQDAAIDKLSRDLTPLVDATVPGNHTEVLKRLDTITNQAKNHAQHMTHVEKLLNRHIRESRAWISEVEKRTAEVDFDVPPWPNLPDHEDD